MDLSWWLAAWLLTYCAWTICGIGLAAWRQPDDEAFFVAMIMWTLAPFWVCFLPLSWGLRHTLVSFWRGMDWPSCHNDGWWPRG